MYLYDIILLSYWDADRPKAISVDIPTQNAVEIILIKFRLISFNFRILSNADCNQSRCDASQAVI